ncbi:HigA family addiction module antitoxin [Xanthobacter flavus]|uniref:HigA family addiction module antitoxin n=1 Tax=Xanthobacter flavus TaxID=281 RepID=UPI003728AB32
MTAHPLPPVHPGEILREEFLAPLGLTAYALAAELKVPRTRIERLEREETSVTADTALRLARYFGTSAEFWLNLQTLHDVQVEQDRLGEELAAIRPREGAGEPAPPAEAKPAPAAKPQRRVIRLNEVRPAAKPAGLHIRTHTYALPAAAKAAPIPARAAKAPAAKPAAPKAPKAPKAPSLAKAAPKAASAAKPPKPPKAATPARPTSARMATRKG